MAGQIDDFAAELADGPITFLHGDVEKLMQLSVILNTDEWQTYSRANAQSSLTDRTRRTPKRTGARPFRFGVLATKARDGRAWRERARQAEASGYTTLVVSDHFDDQWDHS